MDPVEVSIQYSNDGGEGAGYYVWETEYPEEGYIYSLLKNQL